MEIQVSQQSILSVAIATATNWRGAATARGLKVSDVATDANVRSHPMW